MVAGHIGLIITVAILVGHIGPAGIRVFKIVDGESGISLVPIAVGLQVDMGMSFHSKDSRGDQAQQHHQSQQEAEAAAGEAFHRLLRVHNFLPF